MTDIDLDINNYDLNDLLKLFKIPLDFDESDLKNAKAITLKTHPDKSNLHPDYFRFYSKAYKMIYSVWEFRKKGDINNLEKAKNTKYDDINTYDIGEDKKELLDQFFEKKANNTDKKEFNKWFNEQFEKVQIKGDHEEKGYENWLRSSDKDDYGSEDEDQNISMTNMGNAFDKRKEKARALIVHKGIEESYSNSNGYDLSSEAPATYDSDMFSSLPYQDLQKAHVETVIPVTYEDYEKKHKFNSVNDIIAHRGRQDTKPLSEKQAMDYLSNRTKYDEETTVKRAYNLAKQTELAKKKQEDFWASIQLLENGKKI